MVSVDCYRRKIATMIRTLASVVCLFVLAGCTMSTSVLPPAETIEPSAPPSVRSLGTQYDEIRSGALVEISDPAFHGEINAKVGKEYLSAIGLNCYQVKVDDPALAFESVAICRYDTGTWFVAPRIWARSTAGSR